MSTLRLYCLWLWPTAPPTRRRRRVVVQLALDLIGAVILGVSSAPARADLHFTEPVANAGVVYAGAPLIHEFTFENFGPETVSMLEARATCGCLKPAFAQSSYRPSEKGCVKLEVNTLSQAAGPHTWTVTLKYQAGEVPREISLHLNARLATEVAVQPAALIVFADKIAQHELILTDLRSKALVVLDARASSGKVFPRVGEAVRDAEGHTIWKISLAVADDYPDGRHEEFLDVYTNDPRYRNLRVPVTVIKRAQQRLTATPSEVVLVAPAGQPVPSRMILIRDTQGQTVHIDRVLADDPAISGQWTQGPGAMATLRIRTDRRLLAGESLRSAVHVRIDQPIRDTLTIPVTVVASDRSGRGQ